MKNRGLSSARESYRAIIRELVKSADAKNILRRDQNGVSSSKLWEIILGRDLSSVLFQSGIGNAKTPNLELAKEIFEQMGKQSVDSGFNISVAAHFFAGLAPLFKFANDTMLSELELVKSKSLRRSKKAKTTKANPSKLIFATAMTEPESGSDAFKMQTSAKLKGDFFYLDGQKSFVTNGPVADWILVYAVTDASKGFFGGVSAFLVPANARGLKRSKSYQGLGLRTAAICDLELNNVKVSKDFVVGGVGGGATVFNFAMQWERLGIACLHLGQMRKLKELAVDFINDRSLGGQKVSGYQALAHKISNIEIQIEASDALLEQAFVKLKSEENLYAYSSVVKVFVSEALQDCTKNLMQIFAAKGFLVSGEIERAYRDATAASIYTGTSEIHRNIIAKYAGVK